MLSCNKMLALCATAALIVSSTAANDGMGIGGKPEAITPYTTDIRQNSLGGDKTPVTTTPINGDGGISNSNEANAPCPTPQTSVNGQYNGSGVTINDGNQVGNDGQNGGDVGVGAGVGIGATVGVGSYQHDSGNDGQNGGGVGVGAGVGIGATVGVGSYQHDSGNDGQNGGGGGVGAGVGIGATVGVGSYQHDSGNVGQNGGDVGVGVGIGIGATVGVGGYQNGQQDDQGATPCPTPQPMWNEQQNGGAVDRHLSEQHVTSGEMVGQSGRRLRSQN